MRTSQVLNALARRLNREAGAPALPALFFFTDPERTPDPVAVARRLPRGAAVVYRHFGARERGSVARALALVCRRRGLKLLIAADPALAGRVGADGVHWPEARLAERRPHPGLATAAAHSARAADAAATAGVDLCILGPVFATSSASGNAPLGLFRASQIARACPIPVVALGGLNHQSSKRLIGRGFAGIAAVEALAAD